MNKILPALIVLSITLGIAAGFWIGGNAELSVIPKVDGIVLHPSKQINEFKLKDHELKEFSKDTLLGKWHLMFFGYTHCPDICPTTLNTLNSAYKKMSDSERKNTSVVFVSIDPSRDHPQALGEYVKYFNDDFTGVTADEKNLKDFTQQLGIAYAKSETVKKSAEKNQQEYGDDGYLMDHTARILMINPRAEIQAYLKSSRSPQSLLDDVRRTQLFYDKLKPDE